MSKQDRSEQDRSEQFRRNLMEKEMNRTDAPEIVSVEEQIPATGMDASPFAVVQQKASELVQEPEQVTRAPIRLMPSPIEKHIHKEGEACGEYFSGLLSEESDVVFVQGLVDEGMSRGSIMLALIKACLAQKEVARTARFFTDESHDALRVSSGKPNLKECPVCHEQFKPLRGGQMYCCSVCGQIGSGTPVDVSEHEKNCPTQEEA